jgi:membrane protein YqaA with SNARE-associated domain
VSASGLVAALGLYAGTFLVAALGSLVPLVAIDVFLVGVVIALGPPAAALPALVLLAAAGQALGKLPIYYASRGVAGLAGPHRPRIERVRAWAARRRSKTLLLASSAALGLPPFSFAATAAGALAIPAPTFCAVIFAGRALRFALLVAAAVTYNA